MTHLRRLAGHLAACRRRALNRRVRRLLHIDDPARLAVLRDPRAAAPLEQLMLGYQLFHESDGPVRARPTWLDRLNPDLLTELAELADALGPHAHAVDTRAIVPEWPLHFHRRYDRREVQTACGDTGPRSGSQPSRRASCACTDIKTELFFVTLDKSEGGFSPTTSYRDYAISRDHFHWETQNRPRRHPDRPPLHPAARNGWRFLLFVRETRDDAFVALGPVRYVSHTGERPMGITWRLDVPMPAALFERFAALLAA